MSSGSSGPGNQLPLPYIPHAVGGEVISQRRKDGYINATAMCQAAGKVIGHYAENKATKAFLAALSADIGIPISGLVHSIRGGNPQDQGTWVHPQIAINLAQWCSPQFAVLVSKWVFDWMMSSAAPPKPALPFHLRRYMTNLRNVPAGHFSVLNEICLTLIGPMEADGYTLPEQMWPDISQGKMFATYMKHTHGVTADSCPMYRHEFEDGRPAVLARAYPNEYLIEFRNHFQQVWVPQRAAAYFKERDPLAIPFLQKLLPPPTASQT